MTRKDFRLIADTLLHLPSFNSTLRAHRTSTAKAFADALATTNPRFKRGVFLKACGVEE